MIDAMCCYENAEALEWLPNERQILEKSVFSAQIILKDAILAARSS